MTKDTETLDTSELLVCDENPFLRDNIYYAAKDGLSIALFALLDSIDDVKACNWIINQVLIRIYELRILKYILPVHN